MVNPMLENQILAIYNAEGGNATKCYLLGEDWEIKKNKFGVNLYRYVNAIIFYKTSSGGAEKVKYSIRHAADGDTTFKEEIYIQQMAKEEVISPECLND